MPRLPRRRERMMMMTISDKDGEYIQVGVRIPTDTYKAAKIYAVQEGVTMKKLVGDALAEKLKKAKK